MSKRLLMVMALWGLFGCLDPMVDEEVPPAGLVLAPGTEVPRAEDDPAIAQMLAEHDGVDGLVPLLSAFAEGEPIKYWDFGPVPEFAAPVFLLGRYGDGGKFERVTHNTIVEVIPGEPGYSPYWTMFFVEVTDAWDGHIVSSVAAIEEAERLGLVHAPELQPVAVNCPAVAEDVTLEVGNGEDPLPPPSSFYWKGKTLGYYNFGVMPLEGATYVPEAPMFQLRREGSEPLSEPVRGVDMTGDGDRKDTNNLFVEQASDDASPLCRTVEIVVPREYASIDTSGDETIAGFRDARDVFDGEPVAGNVVAFDETDDLRNCVLQREPGGL